MNQHPSQLERVTIGQPCATSWQAMTGDAQRRYCQQCDQHVYNFSAMTHAEIEGLLAATPGRVCARFERKLDGQIVTREHSERATKRRFNLIPRASRITAAAMSALLSVGVNVSKAWAAKPAAQLQSPPQKNDEQNKSSRTSSPLAGIAGTVVDPSGAVIPNAQLTLVNQRTQKTTDNRTDLERFAIAYTVSVARASARAAL